MANITHGVLISVICLSASISSAQPRAVTILHVNDIHGHFLSEPALRQGDTVQIGGFAALSHYLREERIRNPRTLFLNAGDLMTGNPICNMEHRGVFGGALVELLEMLDCEADVIGNHEFDISRENARKLAAMSVYPTLCANIVDTAGQLFAPAAVTTCEVNGVRIGIIGLVLDDLLHVANPTHLEGLEVKDIAATAQEDIDELDPVTDLIILLTHNGFDNDRDLARHVHGADVIVGGHSHTRLSEPARENGILIVQAGSYLKDLGVVDLEVAGDTVYSCRSRLVPLVVNGTQPDSTVAVFCDSLETVIDAEYGQVIGQLAMNWTHGYEEESNVGSWICDRLREAFKADVALVNAGGIRTDIPAGPVTKLQIAQLLPFNNSIVLFSATGAELQRFAKRQGRVQAFRVHGIVEMSGMKIAYRQRGGEIEIVDCQVGNEPLDIGREYRIVSIDYVAESQYERYLDFRPQDIQYTGEMLSDFIIEEVQKTEEPIYSQVEGRLKRVP
jgi:2',3'-cyclic-nucleotide 2'-phosphodiesterase (5'-nucleotidase family)